MSKKTLLVFKNEKCTVQSAVCDVLQEKMGCHVVYHYMKSTQDMVRYLSEVHNNIKVENPFPLCLILTSLLLIYQSINQSIKVTLA